jgi:hypothetical protein
MMKRTVGSIGDTAQRVRSADPNATVPFADNHPGN